LESEDNYRAGRHRTGLDVTGPGNLATAAVGFCPRIADQLADPAGIGSDCRGIDVPGSDRGKRLESLRQRARDRAPGTFGTEQRARPALVSLIKERQRKGPHNGGPVVLGGCWGLGVAIPATLDTKPHAAPMDDGCTIQTKRCLRLAPESKEALICWAQLGMLGLQCAQLGFR